MPENAAAEGGYGLSAADAFGGQVGTGSLGGSAVGGAQGSFGGGDGPGAAGPASVGGPVGVGTYGRSGLTSPDQVAASIASINAGLVGLGIPGGLMGFLGQNVDVSPTAPSVAPGFDPEAVFGMSAPSINPSTGGFLGGSPAPGTAPSVDTSSFSAPAPAPSITPTAAQEMATPVSTAPAVAPAQSQQPGFLGGLFGLFGRNNQPGLFGRNPDLPGYNERGILGKIGMDLAMGLSVNPFAGREDQAAGLRGRGYSPAEIEGYFGRTDATVAANQAAVENGMGSRDFITDTQLNSFAMTLPQSQRMQFNQMDRAGKLRMYYQMGGY